MSVWPVSSMGVQMLGHGISGIQKLRKYEDMKISVSVNPNGAMRSIMYVWDDFKAFFKNWLENWKVSPPQNYIFSESWDRA